MKTYININIIKFLVVVLLYLSQNYVSTAQAIDTCYGGGGLGSIAQDLYGLQVSEENTIINTRAKEASKSSIGLQLFAGCHIYENIDVEIGAIVNKASSVFDPVSNQKIKVSQRMFTIDGIFKAPEFDNGVQLYGKAGGGFFTNQLNVPGMIALDDRFGIHAAAGLSYPITNEVKIRGEYHYIPKGLYYEATPIMVNVTYQFD